MGHYIIPGKAGTGAFLLVGLICKGARYCSYEDMYITAILVMIQCYNCLLAISLLLLYVSIVLPYSKLINQILTSVFLLFGARRFEHVALPPFAFRYEGFRPSKSDLSLTHLGVTAVTLNIQM
jgi:hypothetical protein